MLNGKEKKRMKIASRDKKEEGETEERKEMEGRKEGRKGKFIEFLFYRITKYTYGNEYEYKSIFYLFRFTRILNGLHEAYSCLVQGSKP